ncbi:MAG: hypothetical protein COA42_05960 [Alteromonadaceae bacterium]|nr:MAG: hypothetical protein COA42_05960 [Alteromonadaceae bacterium]
MTHKPTQRKSLTRTISNYASKLTAGAVLSSMSIAALANTAPDASIHSVLHGVSVVNGAINKFWEGSGSPYIDLSARGSVDADGDALSYAWYVDGRFVSGDDALNWKIAPGHYDVMLRVDDGQASSEALIEVDYTGGQPYSLMTDVLVNASSIENNTLVPFNAVDNNPNTRWGSAHTDSAWLELAFPSRVHVNEVSLDWEAAFAQIYAIQMSDDGEQWHNIFTTNAGHIGEQTHSGIRGEGHFLRILGQQRGTQWGYSLWEADVKGYALNDFPVEPVSPEPVVNLLDNGNFDLGLTHWDVVAAAGADALFFLSEGSANITVMNPGTETWSLQLYQTRSLTAGKTYTLDFDIKNDGINMPFWVVIEHGGSPWTKYTVKQFQQLTLANTLKHYELSWVQGATDSNVKIGLHFGQTPSSSIAIDNMRLYEAQ